MSSNNQIPEFRFATGSGCLGPRFRSPLRLPHPVPQTLADNKNETVMKEISFQGMPKFRNPAARLGFRAAQFCSMPTLSSPTSPSENSQQFAPVKNVALRTPSPKSCSCQRPQSLILCSSCGFTFTGRVRIPCSLHPSQIYLMDNQSCPSCGSTSLKEYPS